MTEISKGAEEAAGVAFRSCELLATTGGVVLGCGVLVVWGETMVDVAGVVAMIWEGSFLASEGSVLKEQVTALEPGPLSVKWRPHDAVDGGIADALRAAGFAVGAGPLAGGGDLVTFAFGDGDIRFKPCSLAGNVDSFRVLQIGLRSTQREGRGGKKQDDEYGQERKITKRVRHDRFILLRCDQYRVPTVETDSEWDREQFRAIAWDY